MYLDAASTVRGTQREYTSLRLDDIMASVQVKSDRRSLRCLLLCLGVFYSSRTIDVDRNLPPMQSKCIVQNSS